jgi:transcription-repair coupling factor (superfamily II helicase)
VEGAVGDPENVAERLAVVQRLGNRKLRELIVVLTRRSLEERVPTVESLSQIELTLKRGKRLDREKLLKELANSGYEHVPQVTARGQFAVRGGILDIYSFHHALPARVELFDDEIESLRHFDLDAQTSVQQVESVTLLLGDTASAPKTCLLQEFIAEDDITIDAGADWLPAQVRFLAGAELSGDTAEDYSCAFFRTRSGRISPRAISWSMRSKRERFFDQLTEWRRDGWHVHVFCNNEGEIERLRELVPPVEADALHFSIGPLSRGFTFPAAKVAVLSDAELFGRYRNNRARRFALRRAREVQSRAQIDFSELTEGELVVHLEHGIARYESMKVVPKGEANEEVARPGICRGRTPLCAAGPELSGLSLCRRWETKSTALDIG